MAKNKTAEKENVADLTSLAKGMVGLSATKGGDLADAAGICLHHNHHSPGVQMSVTGHRSHTSSLLFQTPSAQLLATHDDLEEATELGACAVAIVAVCGETGHEVVRRARKKTGVDYWLGSQLGVFEARLEVSGILNGTNSQITGRVKDKLKQMRRSDTSKLPGFAAVVEFSRPRLHVEEK